jgi:CRISPR-associated protein Cmr1
MSAPKEFRVTLETVTPLFLGGAEPRPLRDRMGMPELRPSAFRGVMRYWLRALLGGIYGDNKISVVKKIEGQVFGSAGDKNITQASPITLRIEAQKIAPPEKYQKIKDKNGKPLRPPAGRDYLYWSMDQSGSLEKGNLLNARYYIPPESLFDILLGFRVGKYTEDIRKYAIYSLWLAAQLGGLGARSRRTAGSFTIHPDSKAPYLPDPFQIGTKKFIADQIARALSNIRKAFNDPPVAHINIPSSFDVIHPDVCRIWVIGVAESSDGIVKAIGERMQRYRSQIPPGFTKDNWLLERSIFGLPVKGLDGVGVERRSSPLWLKVSKVDGYFVGIATLFKSQLLPSGEKIGYIDSGGKRQFKQPSGDYTIIENWIASNFADAEEVMYD